MKAIVLSGGSARGAWMCGTLLYLLGDLEKQYDIICGISTGAINGAFLSQFPHGQEKLAITELIKMWSSINTASIYKRWEPFGKLHALWKKSLHDSSPLINLIKKVLNLESIRNNGRQINVGAVSITSGRYKNFDQTSDNFVDAVIASAAMPGIFLPIKIQNEYYVDGGIKTIIPIKTAIEMGADEIDVIITSPEQNETKKYLEGKLGIIDFLKRIFDLSTDKNDIDIIDLHTKLIKINIIRPDSMLIENSLEFNPTQIKEMIAKGYEDAKRQYNV